MQLILVLSSNDRLRATIVQRKQLYYANILAFDAEQFYAPDEWAGSDREESTVNKSSDLKVEPI